MKTAMQELIDHIGEKGIKNYPLDTLELIEELLEKEKQQIMYAHCSGQEIEDTAGYSDAEQYYNETFKL